MRIIIMAGGTYHVSYDGYNQSPCTQPSLYPQLNTTVPHFLFALYVQQANKLLFSSVAFLMPGLIWALVCFAYSLLQFFITMSMWTFMLLDQHNKIKSSLKRRVVIRAFKVLSSCVHIFFFFHIKFIILVIKTIYRYIGTIGLIFYQIIFLNKI